ncbi:MAG: hypothetical protein WAT81_01425, partial [Candidatus Moraniibacteriota bacterium]
MRTSQKKNPLSKIGGGFLVGADQRLWSVRGAPVELVLGLRGDVWVRVIMASATATSVAGRTVGDDGNPGDWDFTLEAGAKRTGSRRDTGDEPGRMLGG